MVITGLSEVIGSWKIIEISLPRMSRMAASSRPSEVDAVERTEPPTMRPGGSATRRIRESAVTLLPQPEFADDGQRLAALEREATRRRPP